jgi:hypothetical protein
MAGLDEKVVTARALRSDRRRSEALEKACNKEGESFCDGDATSKKLIESSLERSRRTPNHDSRLSKRWSPFLPPALRRAHPNPVVAMSDYAAKAEDFMSKAQKKLAVRGRATGLRSRHARPASDPRSRRSGVCRVRADLAKSLFSSLPRASRDSSRPASLRVT